MAQGGELNHEDTVDSLTQFSLEVMPRLQELNLDQMAEAA